MTAAAQVLRDVSKDLSQTFGAEATAPFRARLKQAAKLMVERDRMIRSRPRVVRNGFLLYQGGRLPEQPLVSTSLGLAS